MSYKKIFWGVMLVIIGVLFILKNTGAIYFNWHTVWNLWPVVLILWGISILPVKDWIKLVSSLAIVLISFVAIQQFADNSSRFSFNNKNHQEYDESYTDADKTQQISEKYDAKITKASLNLKVGAGTFKISDTTDQLIDFEQFGDRVKYNMEVQNPDSITSNITLSLKESHFRNRIENDVDIKLNVNPEWDLKLEVGAAEVDFDLSAFKVNSLKLEGGASDIEVKLGDKAIESNVEVNAGAASITLKVPAGVGCQIISNTVLASKDFEGFDKKDGNVYQTPGFETSAKKIKIKAEAGMASISVQRY